MSKKKGECLIVMLFDYQFILSCMGFFMVARATLSSNNRFPPIFLYILKYTVYKNFSFNVCLIIFSLGYLTSYSLALQG
jgi:hypothetical protein